MCDESKFLVNKIKDFLDLRHGERELSTIFLVFKNYYEVIDENKRRKRVWFEEDLDVDDVYVKKTIVGISYSSSDVARWLYLDDSYNAIAFNYMWNKIGRYVVSFDELLNSSFDAFMKSIYVQLLMYIDNGHNIRFCHDILFKKNSTYEILLDTDFNT